MKLFFILIGLFLLSACDQSKIFEEATDMPERKWDTKSTISYSVDIANTEEPYHVMCFLRNTISYPNCNIYFIMEIKDADNKVIESKMQEGILMDCQSGKPFGSGLGDIFDHLIPVWTDYKFPKSGKYTISVRQYMRNDILSEIVAVGVRVEKAN